MSKRQRYKTAPPALSDAEVARIRAAAHRYVLAGGAILLGNEDTGRDDHVATIRERLHPKALDGFDQELERALPSGPDHKDTHMPHENVWSAVWILVAAEADAAYVFGVSVGLELARLMVSLDEHPGVRKSQKGGAR
jgi:hypothetical protein